MHPQPNRLANRRRRAVRQRHEPRFGGRGWEGGDGCDPRAEREAFERLVEGDGDEEDEEGRADGDGERHADKDAMEENAGFEEEALQQHFLLELMRGE